MIINAQAYSMLGAYQVVATAVDHDADRRSYTLLGSAQVVDSGGKPGADVVAALQAMIDGLVQLKADWIADEIRRPWGATL